MNIKNLWLLLTGMGVELTLLSKTMNDGFSKVMARLGQIFRMLDLLSKGAERIFQKVVQDQTKNEKALSDLNQQMAQILEIVLKVQAQLLQPPATKLVIKLGGVTQGENGMLLVADNGSVSATLEADDALGNAGAALDAAPQWSISDASLGAVAPAADGMSALVTLSGKLGQFTLGVTGVAGGQALSAVSDSIEVQVGAAASLKIALTAVAAPVVAPVAPADPSAPSA